MKSRGFTIIELLVVVAIIGVLASIVVASASGAKARSRDAKRVADIKTIQLALELYYNDNGKYPTTLGTLVPSYLPKEPLDPTDNQTAYFYSAVTLPSYGSGNCVAIAVPVKYHLAAKMESNENTNAAALKQDHDWVGAANSGGLYTACNSPSGADFHGNAINCSGTTNNSNPISNPENCYDVTN